MNRDTDEACDLNVHLHLRSYFYIILHSLWFDCHIFNDIISVKLFNGPDWKKLLHLQIFAKRQEIEMCIHYKFLLTIFWKFG